MKDFLTVYISKIPQNLEISKVIPESRNEEIQNCKSDVVQKERYWSWKLLETALAETMKLSVDAANLKKEKSGKWVSDSCYFSLTHSHGLVAVAVSSALVGIDIETWTNFEQKNYNLEKMSKRFLSEEELIRYPDAADKRRFLELWTKKEAAFKENPAEEGFYSKNIELEEKKLFTKYDFLDGSEYCLSVCSELKNKIEILVK